MEPTTAMVHYTLTGAADWPMLALVGGVSLIILQLIVLGLIGVVWRSLPKQQDLQRLKTESQSDLKNIETQNHLDIEKLALRFEHILEKYVDREQTAREKKDDEMLNHCTQQRMECRARYDKQFAGVFTQLQGSPS